MIDLLLPPPLAVAEAFDDRAPAALYPAEARVVSRSVARRRREFATVRACARRALGALNVAPAPILPGERGAPQWPAGTVGSMTHCANYRAAAVAHAGDVVSVGIDAEPNVPLPSDGTRELVTLAAERTHLAALRARRPEVCWDRLVYSAKESVYKTWFPLTGRWLDFEEAEVTVDPDRGTFVARLLVPGPVIGGRRVREFHGSWLLSHDTLLTAIAVTRTTALTGHPLRPHRPVVADAVLRPGG
ncbi:4'-phosphopantetheinyl transferase family protein [Streptomyces boluensis]|uniref:4'-phosphopantetheinyl transferase superfamily protein n=1 Tax=Streptomyces boluensis TaxID=1775135 RepID=A0A964UIT6_9ACTN|nr:4'-phosphopantetheinyl transferase superfamily protein [Streptomyces boluensis]NBE49934.1 4'-phosphopantetheinyl transferase superfamily protein [Streptomyces boluensis]